MNETQTRKRLTGIPPVYFVASLAIMLLLHFAMPGPRWLVAPWCYAGVVPFLLANVMGVTGARMFAKRRTAISPFEEASVLIVDGPYRYSRNPLYASLALTLLAIAMLLGSMTPFFVLPLFVWRITQRFILKEEEALERKFGEKYLAYKCSVRRWFGRYRVGEASPATTVSNSSAC